METATGSASVKTEAALAELVSVLFSFILQ